MEWVLMNLGSVDRILEGTNTPNLARHPYIGGPPSDYITKQDHLYLYQI